MRLKHLLIIVFVCISVIPFFIGLQYLNQYTGDHQRKIFKKHISALSLIAKQRILGAIDRIDDSTALITSRTKMRALLNQWNSAPSQEIQIQLKQIINDAKYGLDQIREIAIYDNQKKLVVTSNVLSDDPNIIYSKARNSQNISLKLEFDTLVLKKLAPLLLDEVEIGYLNITYSANFIIDLVRDRTGLGSTGEWLVAVRDLNGDALFAVPLKYDYKASLKRRIKPSNTEVPIIQALLGHEIIMDYAPDYRGEPVLASTRYLDSLDWGLVAKINEDEVNQLVNQNAVFIYIFAIFVFIIAIAVGVILSIYISKPIERLRDSVNRVSDGKYEVIDSSSGWLEVKELSRQFNQMIHALTITSDKYQNEVPGQSKMDDLSNEKVEQLSLRDPLTTIHNRHYFNKRLLSEVERAKRYSTPLVCVLIDIDHFKFINDKWGDKVGDDVLVGVSRLFAESVRDSDILARLEAGTFCLLLPVCTEDAALLFLERIKAEVSNLEFICEHESFHITCSFGVSMTNDQIRNAESLLKSAQKALSSAKSNGRKSVLIFSDNINKKSNNLD